MNRCQNLSPDPAAQFANPYTYGGDPLNYVDPNGEWVHIVVGAVIGGVVGTVNGVIQCTSAGGGSCTKSIGVGFVGGAAVGAAAAATGGLAAKAVGGGFAGAFAGGAAGGAVGGAGNYVNQSIVNGGFNSGDLWESTWKGAAAGAVGGGAGAWGSGALASMSGGFAGGVTGSALNGGEGWDVLKGGLMGSGMALASYAMVWGYNNYSGGDEINQATDLKNEDVSKPNSAEGEFIPDELLKEAEQFLNDARNTVIENGEDPNYYEAGASFRIRQKFWSGKDYLYMRDDPSIAFIDDQNTGVHVKSYKGDHFRMHLHPKAGISIGHGYTDPYHPSRGDYVSAAIHQKYGIQSYAGAKRNNLTELYRYTYNNNQAKYWTATW